MASASLAAHTRRQVRIETLIDTDELAQYLGAAGVPCGVVDLEGRRVSALAPEHGFCQALSSFPVGEHFCKDCLRRHCCEANKANPQLLLCCQGPIHQIIAPNCKIIGCDSGHIRKFDAVERNLKLVRAVGADRRSLVAIRGLGEGISGQAAEAGEAFFISDVSTDERSRHVLEEGLVSVKSAVYCPLYVQDELVGTLTMHSSQSVPFGDEERAIFADLANRSAIALKAALMYDEIENQLRAKIDALARIRAIGIEFAQTLELDDLLKRVLDGALNESSIEAGTIRILDPARKKLLLGAAKDDSGEGGDSTLIKLTPELAFKEGDFLSKALESEKAMYITDARVDKDFQAFVRTTEKNLSHLALLESVRSVLVVPIRLKERCLGLMFLLCKREQNLLPETIEYVEILANYAAVAIDNAHFYKQREETLYVWQLAMLGTMLSGFLHDIRTSAYRLSTTLEVIRHPKFNPIELNAYLVKVDEEIRRLSDVCADVLLFSRTDRPVSSESVDLNEIVQTSLIETLSNPPGQIRTELELAKPAPFVRGNRVQLVMALRLLIQNAFEAMPNGGLLRVQTRETETNVDIVVSDSGEGMDEITKSRCFEPFFGKKAEKGGTGLGLSVVFGSVGRHSGNIEVESAPKQGTTFTIRLPKGDEL